ncbi:MAG: hypothetical protein DDT30_01727 [Dehalococcoidia bacterium]|nr:hypothetical protein [Bacillota bacterium]
MKRYRLYVDESGDHAYRELEEPARRYLCLLGLFVEVETYRMDFHPALENLKQTHFPHSPDEPVILHRKELVNCRGPFGRLKDPENEERFNGDLLEFLARQEYKLIGVTIDKKTHIERYGDAAYHPYHYCLAALLERYCGFLNFYNAQGDVLAERRGGSEDVQLKEAYRTLFRTGTYFHRPDSFQQALTSREVKVKPKSANIAGLQVADLLAYPVKQEILMDEGRISDPGGIFGKDICRVITTKYNRQIYQDRVQGYGKVFLV